MPRESQKRLYDSVIEKYHPDLDSEEREIMYNYLRGWSRNDIANTLHHGKQTVQNIIKQANPEIKRLHKDLLRAKILKGISESKKLGVSRSEYTKAQKAGLMKLYNPDTEIPNIYQHE